jgi:hypothetical protein
VERQGSDHPERMMRLRPTPASLFPVDDPGFKFWAKLFGLFIVGGIVLFIFLLIFTRAIYAWGILGAFALIAGIALLAAWIRDRRVQRRYPDSSSS